MARTTTFLDEIESSVAGKGHWLECLPPEAREELDEVRKRFKAGKYSARPYQLAGAVIASAERRGWKLPCDKVIVGWLKS